jgi:energy-coupling factor transporter ATP-binding protein EcfA2
VIFNKDAVMVLPSSVNKATGLHAALAELGFSPHNVVGVGDAENDHVFLQMCEFSAAVANALPALKERTDYVTQGRQGEGVEELIEHLLKDDLAQLGANVRRHDLLLGRDPGEHDYKFNPYGTRVVIAGPSGGGKSTTVTAMVEGLMNKGYQVCLIDPEGDYGDFESMITLGGADRIAAASEVLEVLKRPEASVSVNLLGVPAADRPSHFLGLLPRLQELQAKTGRPHWLIIDEAHHLLPADLNAASLPIPRDSGSIALVTVHPDEVSRPVLELMNGLFLIGTEPALVVQLFNKGAGKTVSAEFSTAPEARSGRFYAWMFSRPGDPTLVQLEPPKAELRRHRRKYATGELGEDKSFYFRGPEGKLKLRAQNLKIFTQLASGVDDETWLFHLRQGDYSRWLRTALKDSRVADEVAQVEHQQDHLPAAESRARIIASLDRHYTAPA